MSGFVPTQTMLKVAYEERYSCYFYTLTVPDRGTGACYALRDAIAAVDLTADIAVTPAIFYPRVYPHFIAILPDGEPMHVACTFHAHPTSPTYVIQFRCYQLTRTETVKEVLQRALASMQPGLDEWIERCDAAATALGLNTPSVAVSE